MPKNAPRPAPAEQPAAEWVALTSLHPWDRNPRRNDGAVAKVAASIKRFGFGAPIVARRADGRIIAGHTRFKAAQSLGINTVPVRFLDLDPSDADLLALADNRTSEEAEWDNPLLAEILRELSAEDRAETGFDASEIDSILAEAEAAAFAEVEEDEDAVEEPPAEPRSKPGEVYELGPHRLMCGDSTVVTDVEKACGGRVADLIFTDPPYGIAYKRMSGHHKAIENDGNAGDAHNVARDALALMSGAGAAFVCCDWRSMPTLSGAMGEAGFQPKACIVWDKQRGVQNLDRFHKQHEFILYAGPYGGQKTVDGDVWSVPRDFEPDHPTPKPVELVERAIRSACGLGDLVYDPFAGSGSTLIAAAKTGRKAILIEKDPGYCDVIRNRWERFVAKKKT